MKNFIDLVLNSGKVYSEMTVELLKDTWPVYLVDGKFLAKVCRKRFKGDVGALTYFDHKAGRRGIFIGDTSNNKHVIMHELTHAYLSYTPASFTAADIEEYYCEMLAGHHKVIERVALRILRVLKKNRRPLKRRKG